MAFLSTQDTRLRDINMITALDRTWIVLGLLLVLNMAAKSQQSGTGIGIVIGEPTALNAKHWLNPSSAVQGTLGWSSGRSSSEVFIAADILWHENAALSSGGRLPLFYGVGVYAGKGAGIRATLGMGLYLTEAPMDIFFQVHPAFSLSPSTAFGIQAGLGARWFLR